jgi:hypothetical protein
VKLIKREKCTWLVLSTQIRHDARSTECQIYLNLPRKLNIVQQESDGECTERSVCLADVTA